MKHFDKMWFLLATALPAGRTFGGALVDTPYSGAEIIQTLYYNHRQFDENKELLNVELKRI